MAPIHIPFSLEQDEDGWYCAYAPFVTDEVHGGANGVGRTPEEAIADLREALEASVAQYGVKILKDAELSDEELRELL